MTQCRRRAALWDEKGMGIAMKAGIQLYSVRESLKKDPFGTLEQVAAAGYYYLEAANHQAAEDCGVGFGIGAADLLEQLKRHKLKIVGCHVNPLKPELLPAILAYQKEIGNKQIGCDIAFYPYDDMDFLLARCKEYNEIGALCKAQGIRFYYHNHFQEFQVFSNGKTVYEMLMENTDPELMWIELDTYWAARGGVDPAVLMAKYRDRVLLLHQKDFPADAGEPLNVFQKTIQPTQSITFDDFLEVAKPGAFTEIGKGILPIAYYLSAAANCPNLEYVLLEQDHTRLGEISSIRLSIEGFRRFRKIEWD